MNKFLRAKKAISGKLLDHKYRLLSNYDIGGFRRIYHIHIRKTGGTSLNNMFLDLAKKSSLDQNLYKELIESPEHRILRDGKVYVGWNTRLINQGSYFYAFSHLPLHTLSLPPKTCTITVLRDPVRRVLSHYKMLVEYRDNTVDHPAMKVEGAWLGESFDDFLVRIPSQDLLRQLYMFSPSLDVEDAYHQITSCSHFMFTEDFEEGVRALNSKLGLNLVPIHIRRTKSSGTVSDGQLTRLREALDAEYQLIDRLKHFQRMNNQVAT